MNTRDQDLIVRFQGDVDQDGWIWTIWHADGQGFPKYADLAPHFSVYLKRLGRDGWECYSLNQRVREDWRRDVCEAQLRRPSAGPGHVWQYLVVELTRSGTAWVITAINAWDNVQPRLWHDTLPRLQAKGWRVVQESILETTASVEVLLKRSHPPR